MATATPIAGHPGTSTDLPTGSGAGELAASLAITRIRPTSGSVRLDLRELWEYRELLYFFVWRDLKVRYKRTVVGAAWVVIQPLLTMVVFTTFLGRLAGIPSDGAPYAVFTYAALVPWTYFASVLTASTNAVVDHGGMITKVYFPRLLLPLAPTVTGLLDLSITFAVLLVLTLAFRVSVTPTIVLLPVFVLLIALTALGAGLWLSALNARFRDVRYTVPFLVQLLMFLSPVAYPSSIVPAPWRLVYRLNPIATGIDGFRWALLGSGELELSQAVGSVAFALLLFAGGLAYFQRVQRSFADIV